MERRQRGASFWQLLVVVLVGGFFVLVALKIVPLYLNELKVATAVKEVAQEATQEASLTTIRNALGRHWDIDDIDQIQPKDILLVRDGDRGAALSWDYDAQVHLFSNIYVVINFTGSHPLGGRD
ncbi:MAG: DUF4845 domain-containing protein [Nevskiaceae bacterium]|nr:MAG: DUF4845 domain-containing protein [Nevskiaceae bacterium]TBR73982.1 MAG: DUF4845 domain-containing protein [Nevskiaceae bacterium]